MSFDMELDDDFAHRRLQRLEHRHRRAQNVLGGAKAVYESLREVPGACEIQLRQALQRVEQAQEQLADIRTTIEFWEDQEYIAQGT